MNREEILRAAEEEKVRFLRLQFTDIMGIIKNVEIPRSQFEKALDGQIMFDGSSIEGFSRIEESDMLLVPDEETFCVNPWSNPDGSRVARMICDVHQPDGSDFAGCPRLMLKRQVARAKELGFTMVAGPEAEFFLFQKDDEGRTLVETHDVGGYFDLTPVDKGEECRRDIVIVLEAMGFEVEAAHHEVAPGQHEIDFKYADALTMSDRLVFFRMMANEIARKHGAFASFMPKPFADRTGSGAHYNMSLADLKTGENLFEPKGDDLHNCGISKIAYHFTAGVLKHGAAISAVIAPTVNSYKRLVRQGSMSGSTWAPVFMCYGSNNRTNMIRIPGMGGRIECRAADIACNPYLGSALILAAGLEGIREGLDAGAPHHENMYNYSDAEIAEQGIEYLPRNLGEAVEAFEADPLAKEVFGEAMFKSFIDFKKGEWESYQNHVSAWEVDRYLKMF